nr:KRAB-A domain-containing protein 2-like isoform X1 [Halyomorpha halys]
MAKSERFYELLRREQSKVNCVSMDKVKYEHFIKKVKTLKVNPHKDGNDYRFLKRYDVIEINGVTKLISPATDKESITYFVYDEELFEVLNDAHITTGHGGRDRMVKHLKSKYKNITYKDILLFLSLCQPCLQKQKSQKKGIVAKSLLFKELDHRCQVNLIDFQSQPDKDFKFILAYQDHLTKFVVLRALKTKMAAEVCEHIIDIFTLLGAPSILLSDNGQEFVNTIMNNLVDLWPNFKIVHGKPNQGIAEKTNQEIENMLSAWMKDHKTSNWSYGLKFVQLMKNCALHSALKKSPYEGMFGCSPQLGLAKSSIPKKLLNNIQTEEDLETVIREDTMGGEPETENQFLDEQICNCRRRRKRIAALPLSDDQHSNSEEDMQVCEPEPSSKNVSEDSNNRTYCNEEENYKTFKNTDITIKVEPGLADDVSEDYTKDFLSGSSRLKEEPNLDSMNQEHLNSMMDVDNKSFIKQEDESYLKFPHTDIKIKVLIYF